MPPRFTSPETELPRDRWGRPLITPPDGGEPVAYTRATTFAGTLDDTSMLTKWKMRNVAIGVARSKALQMGALAADPQDRSGKKTLDEIAENALAAANGSDAATTGTALHSFTEKIERGQPLGYVPEEYLPDLDAYRGLLARERIETIAVEGFCVLDDLGVGGTYDRLNRTPLGLLTPDGRDLAAEGLDVVGDVKTGGIDFAIGKIGMQLAEYSLSEDYDHRNGARAPLGTFSALPGKTPRPVSQDWGIIIHLPAGTGTASLVWVNLTVPRAALQLARDVRAYRAGARNLSSKFASISSAAPPPVTAAEALRAATTVAELRAVHPRYAAEWTPGLTSLAQSIMKEKGWA